MIHEAVNRLLGIKRGEIPKDVPIPTRVNEPTPQLFFIDWDDAITSDWNELAFLVVLGEIAKRNSQVDEQALRASFRTYGKYLRSKVVQAREGLPSKADKEMDAARNARNVRRRNVRNLWIGSFPVSSQLTASSVAFLDARGHL